MIAYAITDPSTLSFSTLSYDLELFSQRADMILYRDKSCSNYSSHAKTFLLEARQHAFTRILLHGDYKLAAKLGADGVHLMASQAGMIAPAKALGLFVIISTHTFKEIHAAVQLGADMVTFSPIFRSPSKGRPKGLELLRQVVLAMPIPIIALGGIVTLSQIHAVEACGVAGFASIRYFNHS